MLNRCKQKQKMRTIKGNAVSIAVSTSAKRKFIAGPIGACQVYYQLSLQNF
jgi:hypothetical protein